MILKCNSTSCRSFPNRVAQSSANVCKGFADIDKCCKKNILFANIGIDTAERTSLPKLLKTRES